VRRQARHNGITVETVEGVADGDEVEGSIERHVLGRPSNPADGGYSETLCLALAQLDRLRFLVDGPNLSHIRRQCERHLASAIRKVEQPARPTDGDAGSQIVEQRRRVRRPEPVVVLGCVLVQVSAVPEFGSDRMIVARSRPGVCLAAGVSGRGQSALCHGGIGCGPRQRVLRPSPDLLAWRMPPSTVDRGRQRRGGTANRIRRCV
jgi:hypothetical protein